MIVDRTTMEPRRKLSGELARRYRLERELASGGFGAVYLATDLTLDRPVALKLLHAETLAEPDLVRVLAGLISGRPHSSRADDPARLAGCRDPDPGRAVRRARRGRHPSRHQTAERHGGGVVQGHGLRHSPVSRGCRREDPHRSPLGNATLRGPRDDHRTGVQRGQRPVCVRRAAVTGAAAPSSSAAMP